MDVVNGYRCRDNTDRQYAKQGIDPGKPEDGANGANAKKEAEVVARTTADAIRLSAEATAAREEAQARAQAAEDAAAAAARANKAKVSPPAHSSSTGEVVSITA